MEALVNASFAEDVLFDRTVDHEIVESELVLRRGGFPALGRYDLSDFEKWKKKDPEGPSKKNITLTMP